MWSDSEWHRCWWPETRKLVIQHSLDAGETHETDWDDTDDTEEEREEVNDYKDMLIFRPDDTLDIVQHVKTESIDLKQMRIKYDAAVACKVVKNANHQKYFEDN